MKKISFILLIFFGFFSCFNNEGNIEMVELWENGNIKSKKKLIGNDSNSYLEKTYYEDGSISREKIYIDGDLEKFTSFYLSGEIEALFVYENKEIVAGAEYYRNGQKMGEVPKNLKGKINGDVKYFFESGKIKSQGKYENDKKIGIWLNFDELGNLTKADTIK